MSAGKKDFEKQYQAEQKKRGERKKHFRTSSNIDLPAIFDDESGSRSYADALGYPGSYPYTRGVYPTMYRGRPWTIRQYAGFGTAKETNERFHFLLKKGQKGLSVAFDLPTQMGYDSDDAMAMGEVGKVGVAIDTVDDMRVLMDGIPLGDISTSMTINATAAILLSMYIAVGDERGIDRGQLGGTVQNDILKEYIARGTFIFPPAPSMRLITDMFSWCSEHLPNWNPISISGYHVREAGSTAAQEIAFTLANAIAYVEAGRRAGLDVDQFAPRLSFFFNVHNQFLEEIAKFRAARRMWAQIMKKRFNARKDASMRLRFHTQTAGVTLTAQQPKNNVVRVALQAMAAILGGTQSLHTNSMDEALGLPSDEAARLALRTQQVILEESGVTDTIDPMGGSYAIEALTDRLQSEAEKIIERIDGMGGMVEAIGAGYPQREIERASYEYQLAMERGDQNVVGVNVHTESDDVLPPVFKIDPALEREQVTALQQRRKTRDSGAADASLTALDNAAQGPENLFPHVLHAVKSNVSVGEICKVLTGHFGRYREQSWG